MSIDPNDASLGRIQATLVAPPFTALCVKRCLCQFEGLTDFSLASLYATASSLSPIDDDKRVSILTSVGPGSLRNEPMVLVVSESQSATGLQIFIPSPEANLSFDLRRIYYRLFLEDGAISSKMGIDRIDPSLGRITGTSVAPPLTALSLKRYLCSVEDIANISDTKLYVAAASHTPMSEDTIVNILTGIGPGLTRHEPMALVILSKSMDNSHLLSIYTDVKTNFNSQHIYFRNFAATGPLPSRKPIKSQEPSLSRINILEIPPPHTAGCIVRCLAGIEDISDYMSAKLFWDLSSDSPLEHEERISIFTTDRPGSMIDNPMVFFHPESNSHIRLETPTVTFEKEIKNHINGTNSIAFSPDGQWIAAGGKSVGNAHLKGAAIKRINDVIDHSVIILNANTGELIRSLSCGNSALSCIAFSPDGQDLIACSGAIHIWNVKTGERKSHIFKGHQETFHCVAFSPDSRRIVSGSKEQTIHIWNARTGEKIFGPIKGHTSLVRGVVLSPSGRTIVSGSEDKSIRVWDSVSGKLLLSPLTETSPVRSVAYSPDGQTLVCTCSSDRSIKIRNSKSGSIIAGPMLGHTAPVSSIVFSPNGLFIVSGSSDRMLRIWDAKTGEALGSIEAHRHWGITSIAYSPDGARIAVGCGVDTIKLFKVT